MHIIVLSVQTETITFSCVLLNTKPTTQRVDFIRILLSTNSYSVKFAILLIGHFFSTNLTSVS